MSYKNNKKRRKKKRRAIAELAKRRAVQKIVESEPKTTVDVSKYIQHLDPTKHQHYHFQLIARVSYKKQRKEGHLDSQIQRMRKYASDFYLSRFPTIHCLVASTLWLQEERKFLMSPKSHIDPKLYKPHYYLFELFVWSMKRDIIELGLKEPVAFLFEDLSRVLRADDYDFENNRDAIPTEEEQKVVVEIFHPFPIFSICRAGMTYNEVERYRKIYGADCKVKRQPGDLKFRKKENYSEVARLRFIEENSLSEISEMTGGIPRTTIADWCKEVSELLEIYEK